MVQTITNPPAEKLHPAYLRLQKLTDLSYIMNRSGVSSEIKNSRGNMDYDKNTKKLRRSYHQANRSLKRHIMECFLERYKWVEFNSILDKYVPFESKRNKKRNRSTEETLIIKIAARLRGDPDQNEDLLLKSEEDVTDYFNKLSLADDVDDNLNSLNNDDAQLPAEGGEEAATTVDEHNPNEDAPLVLDCHANGVDDGVDDDGDGQKQQQQQQHQQHQQQLLQRMPATSTSTPSSSSSSLSSDESKLSSSDELPDESLNESTVSSSSSLLSSASSLSSKVGGGEEDDDDDDDDYIAVDDDDDDDDDDDVTTTDIILTMEAPTDNPTTLNLDDDEPEVVLPDEIVPVTKPNDGPPPPKDAPPPTSPPNKNAPPNKDVVVGEEEEGPVVDDGPLVASLKPPPPPKDPTVPVNNEDVGDGPPAAASSTTATQVSAANTPAIVPPASNNCATAAAEIIKQGFKRAPDDVLNGRKIYKINRTAFQSKTPATASVTGTSVAATTNGTTTTSPTTTTTTTTDNKNEVPLVHIRTRVETWVPTVSRKVFLDAFIAVLVASVAVFGIITFVFLCRFSPNSNGFNLDCQLPPHMISATTTTTTTNYTMIIQGIEQDISVDDRNFRRNATDRTTTNLTCDALPVDTQFLGSDLTTSDVLRQDVPAVPPDQLTSTADDPNHEAETISTPIALPQVNDELPQDDTVPAQPFTCVSSTDGIEVWINLTLDDPNLKEQDLTPTIDFEVPSDTLPQNNDSNINRPRPLRRDSNNSSTSISISNKTIGIVETIDGQTVSFCNSTTFLRACGGEFDGSSLSSSRTRLVLPSSNTSVRNGRGIFPPSTHNFNSQLQTGTSAIRRDDTTSNLPSTAGKPLLVNSANFTSGDGSRSVSPSSDFDGGINPLILNYSNSNGGAEERMFSLAGGCSDSFPTAPEKFSVLSLAPRMSMRAAHCNPGEKIQWYTVSWPTDTLSWEDFRGDILGATIINYQTSIAGTIDKQPILDYLEAALGLLSPLELPRNSRQGLEQKIAAGSQYQSLKEDIKRIKKQLYGLAILCLLLFIGTVAGTVMAVKNSKDTIVDMKTGVMKVNDGADGVDIVTVKAQGTTFKTVASIEVEEDIFDLETNETSTGTYTSYCVSGEDVALGAKLDRLTHQVKRKILTRQENLSGI